MAEKADVFIIGGGISGITVALELAQVGIPTTLVEREPAIGGLSSSFCCKASEACNKCFACVVDKRISEVRNRPEISILTQTEPVSVKENSGEYTVSLKRGKERFDRKASAVVIAAGINPFDASQKIEYGYGRFKNVITAKDLERNASIPGNILPSLRRATP